MPSTRRHHHHVYVVELDDRVWNEPRFRKANPDYRLDKPLVYVGMTGTDPDLRFEKHKAGFKVNRFVQFYGLCLLHPEAVGRFDQQREIRPDAASMTAPHQREQYSSCARSDAG